MRASYMGTVQIHGDPSDTLLPKDLTANKWDWGLEGELQ